MKRLGIAVTAALAVLLGWSPPVSAHSTAPAGRATNAVPGYGPKTIVMTTCSLPPSTLDDRVPASVLTALGPAAGIYGFASCRTNVPGAIYFFLSRAGRSMHELTPYRGVLETMASDGTGAVYLCFSVRTAVDTSLYIARRSAQGSYSPPALLTHTVGTSRPSVTLAAANGRWWAVWSEATSTARFPARVLYERRTMFSVRPRHQITFPGFQRADWRPALAVFGGLARLAWLRGTLDGFTAYPLISSSLLDGSWRLPYVLSNQGDRVADPTQMVIPGGRTFLLLPPALYLDNGTGHFVQDPTVTAYHRPQLAVSADVATVAELITDQGPRELRIHELRAGIWDWIEWPTFDSFDGLVSSNGRATFVMHKQSTPMLYLITEQ